MTAETQTGIQCPGCQRQMMTNGYTVWCENTACAFNTFQPKPGVVEDDSLPRVLSEPEVNRIYLEGVQAFKDGKQFHECPYAKPGDDVPDDEYQRGVEWRRGWNDAALSRDSSVLKSEKCS